MLQDRSRGGRAQRSPSVTSVEHRLPSSGPPSGPYSISVESGRFKSIAPPLEWENIPQLAVLTGLNGSGKSQFLQAIAMKYNVYRHPSVRDAPLAISVLGVDAHPHEVLFLDNFSSPLDSGTSGISHLDERLREYRTSSEHSDVYNQHIAHVIRSADCRLTYANLHEFFYYDPSRLARAIAHHFVSHKLHRAFTIERLHDEGKERGDVRAIIGDSPWDELNAWLDDARFPYLFEAPAEIAAAGANFRLLMRHTSTNDIVAINDLSSGESSIVRFLLMMFAASKKLSWLKLILLDEPDSHLHASLISSFLMILQRLTESCGTRIIMSTHRIETIGFAPEGSVFVMDRQPPRIRCCDDKIRTVGMLTGNLFGMIMANRRPVFVEDRDDVLFYAAVLDALIHNDQWDYHLSPEFVAVSDWASVKREAGGKGAVRKAVASLAGAGLNGLVSGIIDRDEGETEEKGIQGLGRYAVENYLLDPVVMYVFLLDRDLAPPLRFAIRLGEEGRLAEKTDEELQEVVDAVLRLYEPKVPDILKAALDERAVPVTYSNGRRVVVPAWLHRARGHDLMHALKSVTPAGDRASLVKAFKRLKLVPEELRHTLLATVGAPA